MICHYDTLLLVILVGFTTRQYPLDSELTPLKTVSGCKSDHKDLMHTHVWDYSCYVLVTKL